MYALNNSFDIPAYLQEQELKQRVYKQKETYLFLERFLP
jgi:hypothetical protein